MLALSEFPGDDNQTVKRMQLDLYGDMVNLMFATQRQRYLDAANLLGIDNTLSLRLRQITTFDQRTLQHAHDQIAALFRFLHPNASQLPLGHSEASLTNQMQMGYCEFFEEQLTLLTTDGEFTRAVCSAAAFANQPLGQAAEESLRQLLVDYLKSKGFTFNSTASMPEYD